MYRYVIGMVAVFVSVLMYWLPDCDQYRYMADFAPPIQITYRYMDTFCDLYLYGNAKSMVWYGIGWSPVRRPPVPLHPHVYEVAVEQLSYGAE